LDLSRSFLTFVDQRQFIFSPNAPSAATRTWIVHAVYPAPFDDSSSGLVSPDMTFNLLDARIVLVLIDLYRDQIAHAIVLYLGLGKNQCEKWCNECNGSVLLDEVEFDDKPAKSESLTSQHSEGIARVMETE
jgi:hypothetical protein